MARCARCRRASRAYDDQTGNRPDPPYLRSSDNRTRRARSDLDILTVERGVLLDTHALYWLVSGTDRLSESATLAIARAQASDRLLVSAITGWELGVISQKPRREDRPDLGQLTPQHWFQDAIRLSGARIVSIGQRIALVSAEVAMETGHKDPGDCFLMATARVRQVPIVTRDRRMIEISRDRPAFLSVIPC